MFLVKPRYINAGGRLLDLEIPKVMGILNITPDSFYAGSRYNSEKEILSAATMMLERTLRDPELKISLLRRKAHVFLKPLN